jgi:protocatechuate 3,4-dioxygenase beta subunit
MKRALVPAGLFAAAIAALLVWQCGGRGAPSSGQGGAAGKVVAGKPGAAGARTERPDPRTVKRASIEGTITDEDKAIVPGARVCADGYADKLPAELMRDPRCTTADDKGHYVLKELFVAEYVVSASAKPYRPGTHHPKGDRKETSFELTAGEHKTGVDIVLRKGGVEITGTVSDVSGGPIGRASVRAGRRWSGDRSPPVETDDAGKFSMWVRPGEIEAVATADGYAAGEDNGTAPGTFEILLTPESSLSGVVVDAKTGTPMPGVDVDLSTNEWGFWSSGGDKGDRTDEEGKFRITRLEPGRYVAKARSASGYGISDGSTLVGLGQHVEGVVVKLHAAYRVSGVAQLPDKTVCKKAWFSLRDEKRDRDTWGTREPDGMLHADGVLPGTYKVNVNCEGYLERDKYPDVVVKDKDVDGLVWEVEAGAEIKGRVLARAGTPIEDANIWARNVGGAARAKTTWGSDRSARDGTYSLKGLKAAKYKIETSSDKGNAPKDGWKLDVTAGAVIEKDLVLEDGGVIKGTVVDAQGKAVAGVNVRALSVSGTTSWNDSNVRTGADGSFVLDNVEAGSYRVLAHRGWWSDELRKPGTTDDAKQGERVTVVAAKTATVKLVVESQSGTIKGTVLDSNGAPVSDAFVAAARESDAAGSQRSSVQGTRWSADERPVLSGVDGTFTITKLSPGNYTLRAFRKGGGEAVAEHVAVGSTTKLLIKATGSIAGTIKGPGKAIEEVELELLDHKTGFRRREQLFRTQGVFAMKDLPAGKFILTVTSEGGKKQLEIELAEGQQKTGVEIMLDELVTLTGRVVDLVTKQPVPGIRMSASLGKRGGRFTFGGESDDSPSISDNDGKFMLEDSPRGAITIRGFAKDWGESDYGWIMVLRDITGSGTIDLGDLTIAKKRVKDGDPTGDLGVRWAENPRDIELDKRILKISYIDPQGPAAKTELKVGDIVISVDGVDVTGVNFANGWTLMRAPPGTKLELGLQRGVKVPIVLAAP